jgi:hypothetical protein
MMFFQLPADISIPFFSPAKTALMRHHLHHREGKPLLKRLRHRLFTLMATLLFIGCLHSASLDESRMPRNLQPSLSALSSNLQDIREVLARCAGEEEEERLNGGDMRIEARAAGEDEVEDKRQV